MTEIKAPSAARDPVSVSIHLATAAEMRKIGPSRARLAQMSREAETQLEALGAENRGIRPVSEQVQDLIEDDEFWRMQAYARKVVAALRRCLTGRTKPPALAVTAALLSIFRPVNSDPHLADEAIEESPTTMIDADVKDGAQPMIRALRRLRVTTARALFAAPEDQCRATADIARAARIATFGAVETLLVDIGAVVPGMFDEEAGAVTFAGSDSAESYGAW